MADTPKKIAHLVTRQPGLSAIDALKAALAAAEAGDVTSVAIGAWGPDRVPMWFISDECDLAVIAPLEILKAQIIADATLIEEQA